jgi:hypothetical protein
LAVLDRWADDERIEIGFLIYPKLALGRPDFDDFVARLGKRESERHPLGKIPFVFAAFHPEAEPDTSDPERLVPFLRRTPDPCIQALRATVLDRVRSGAPQGTQFVDLIALESGQMSPVPLRERIASANLETARRMGIGELRGRLDAIRRDRDETYEALVERESAVFART